MTSMNKLLDLPRDHTPQVENHCSRGYYRNNWGKGAVSVPTAIYLLSPVASFPTELQDAIPVMLLPFPSLQ